MPPLVLLALWKVRPGSRLRDVENPDESSCLLHCHRMMLLSCIALSYTMIWPGTWSQRPTPAWRGTECGGSECLLGVSYLEAQILKQVYQLTQLQSY
jgi:hypothetical protein